MTHDTRRRAILQFGIAGLGAMVAGQTFSARAPRGFFEKHGLSIGLQLYTVMEASLKDFAGTLARVAGAGFRSIELAGFHGRTVPALRDAATRAGVTYTSIHVPAQSAEGQPGLDGDLPRLAADAHALGIKTVVMPSFPIPDRLRPRPENEGFVEYFLRVATSLTADDWKRTAVTLNDIGTKLKREGLRLTYHNHNPEHAPLGGTTGYDILVSGTDPALVSFEMDVAWVATAGVDPVTLLRRYPHRFRQLHVKDIRASTPLNYVMKQDSTEVGRGRIDWKKVLPAAYAAGVREFFVEQEPPFDKDPFVAIADSRAYLAAMS
jgi:sugar phosphate isomerase/epimerase